MADYYDGTKLLSLKDINGNTPEIYLCTSNRAAGKTTFFSKLCVRKYLNNIDKKINKFFLIYRFAYEVDDVANKFFKDIGELFFPNKTMKASKKAKGVYTELFLDEKSCGYAASLNQADQLKKFSHIFSDVCCMFMDEFQSEQNKYAPKEIEKFQSIHTTVARGQGKQNRYVPVYMCGNPVSVVNPYYLALGITNRLQKDTHFMRGVGWVLEQGFNESASNALKSSAFNSAFSNNKYAMYAQQNIYLNDSQAFIEKPRGKNIYLCTLKYNDKLYGVRLYPQIGVAYCDISIDDSCSHKIALTTDDHQTNYIMLGTNAAIIQQLKYYFYNGSFRFKNQLCKDVIISAII